MTPYDIIVIGGGPAGLLATATAAANGASTLLVERMDQPGQKLRLCGHGRGNIGNTAPMDEFLSHFGHNFRFLRPAFAHFFTTEMRTLFDTLGVPTKVEEDGRIFPASDRAKDLAEALLRHVRSNGASIRANCRARHLERRESHFLLHTEQERFESRRVILSTGGASYPATGSSGDGYALAQSLGHGLTPISPALVPLVSPNPIVLRLQGVSLPDARTELRVHGKKTAQSRGEILFTHFGISGPAILTLSKAAVRALDDGPVEILLDFFPDAAPGALDTTLTQSFNTHGKKRVDNVLRAMLPPKLITACLDQLGIDPSKNAHQISAGERKALRLLCKEFRLNIQDSRSLKTAMVTAGGVPLPEVNPKTMESRRCPGLFLAGEVLDYDADTGGFNLQAALSSGYLAGLHAARGLDLATPAGSR